MSSAEAMAAAFEEDGGKDLSTGTGKRTKSERVEHKHSAQPGGDTRKVVQTATNGEAKRKEKWFTRSPVDNNTHIYNWLPFDPFHNFSVSSIFSHYVSFV